MRHVYLVLISMLFGLTSSQGWASGLEEARALKERAVGVLKNGSAQQQSTDVYADAVLDLEEAMKLIEQANATETDLAVEVSNALYWARKFTNAQAINKIAQKRGTERPPVTTSKPAAPPKVAETKKPEEGADAFGADLAEARKKFEAAQAQVKNLPDDYAVALFWFKTSEELQGTDYAVRAMTFAKEAQERYALAEAKKTEPKAEELPDTEEMKLVAQGDALLAQGNLDGAVAKYNSSIALKDTAIAQRKAGDAYFVAAQKLKEDLIPKFEAVQAEGKTALSGAYRTVQSRFGTRRVFNPNHPPLVKAKEKYNELMNEAKKAFRMYDSAARHFVNLGKLDPEAKLYADAHEALCYSVRGDTYYRTTAISKLAKVIQGYEPKTDVERTLHEYCRTELERIRNRL
jgi:tetratricopeptide (TPR) repeat protein